MSSATPSSPVDVSKLPVEGEGGQSWLSERQRSLERLYQKFRCEQYAGRSCDWDGNANVGEEQADGIARSGVLPPGFEMTEGLDEIIPLRFRRPCAPVAYGRAIPMKLSSMLFGAKKHPKIVCDDPLTEDWLQGFAEATRLWSKLKQARNLGGGMGSVALGFKFQKGKPIVEVHDPRWCTPTFSDRSELVLERIEKRYQYTEQVKTEEGWENVAFWYRRVITDAFDVIWPKVRVEEGEEPVWLEERYSAVQHGYGFCPVFWIQNQAIEEAIDGDEDCHGVWDLIESIDMLNSQARRGTISNCDPTVVISSDADWEGFRKGSGRAPQTEKGGSVQYLEMTGSGLTAARQLRDDMLEQLCTVARVSLDRNEGGPSRTVEEVEHVYSSMLENCDELREQYGEFGIKRLLEHVLIAARKLEGVRVDTEEVTGIKKIVRSTITLPKRRIKDEKTGKTLWLERRLGVGEQLELRWPPYYTPSATEITARVSAAGQAKAFGIVDQKHATEYVAGDFQIEDVAAVMRNIATEQKAAGALGGTGGNGGSLAQKVTERAMSGAKNALPNPDARQLSAVARSASK